MSRTAITPLAHERPFAAGELFFSTTDGKGIIRSGNDVFVRISGHPVERLIGAPHNIIRHPDMPKAVFRLLWDYLGQDKAFAGYVKNMAADGTYYWVTALVVPIDQGYLSIRFKPSSPLFPIVSALYADLLATERDAVQSGLSWKEGMARAGQQLIAAINSHGFATYDDFMRVMLATELSSHAAAIAAGRTTIPVAAAADGESARGLMRMLDACRGVDRHLDDLFSRVDGFLSTIKHLDSTSDFMLGLANDIQMVSLNTLIASCRLQVGGEGLSVVTQDLARISGESTGTIGAMHTQLTSLTSPLRDAAFSIVATKLQVEMTIFFLQELIGADRLGHRDPASEERVRNDVATLVESLSQGTSQMVTRLPLAQAPIPRLIGLQRELASDLRRLASVHLLGKIHAVGVSGEAEFRELLDRIVSQLERASSELDDLSSGVQGLRDRLPLLEHTAVASRRCVLAIPALSALTTTAAA
jgi:PAS domain S-box-containing protein